MYYFPFFRINGPYSAHAAYLSEFHAAKYRARILMIRGLIISSSNVLAALLAWGILPSGMQLFLFEKLSMSTTPFKNINLQMILSFQSYILGTYTY